MRKCILAVAILFCCLMILANAIHPLRLHIVANSNSPRDQQIKLAVRDYILQEKGTLLGSFHSKEDAQIYLRDHTRQLEALAAQVLQAYGANYAAQAQVTEAIFPEKQYGSIVYPAGRYDALRIVLGEGKGENWWCVMFPPLCLAPPQSTGEMQYTSLLLTWFQGLFGRK